MEEVRQITNHGRALLNAAPVFLYLKKEANYALDHQQWKELCGDQWYEPDDHHMPYRVIICRCRKRDVSSFMAAASELTNKMLLCGHPDYPAFCDDLRQKILDRRSMGGGDHNETACASEKAEQESAKRASCQAAR